MKSTRLNPSIDLVNHPFRQTQNFNILMRKLLVWKEENWNISKSFRRLLLYLLHYQERNGPSLFSTLILSDHGISITQWIKWVSIWLVKSQWRSWNIKKAAEIFRQGVDSAEPGKFDFHMHSSGLPSKKNLVRAMAFRGYVTGKSVAGLLVTGFTAFVQVKNINRFNKWSAMVCGD